VCDGGREVIHRYSLYNNVITKWSVGGDCRGLSLTSTYNVLVTLWDTKEIREYTPDGSFIGKISLHSSIEYPYHSIELSSDRFVVSQWEGSFEQRVCLVDTRGHIIQCYGGAHGSGVGQWDEPRHLTIDGHGNMLVANYYNNRVVLLSPSLTHLGYIEIPEHQLTYPRALYLDEQDCRLFIGEFNTTGRVFVIAV